MVFCCLQSDLVSIASILGYFYAIWNFFWEMCKLFENLQKKSWPPQNIEAKALQIPNYQKIAIQFTEPLFVANSIEFNSPIPGGLDYYEPNGFRIFAFPIARSDLWHTPLGTHWRHLLAAPALPVCCSVHNPRLTSRIADAQKCLVTCCTNVTSGLWQQRDGLLRAQSSPHVAHRWCTEVSCYMLY